MKLIKQAGEAQSISEFQSDFLQRGWTRCASHQRQQSQGLFFQEVEGQTWGPFIRFWEPMQDSSCYGREEGKVATSRKGPSPLPRR